MTLKDAILEAQGTLLEAIDKRTKALPNGSHTANRVRVRELGELRAAYERIEQEYRSLERAEEIEAARTLLAEVSG
jgi:hypothetical protein